VSDGSDVRSVTRSLVNTLMRMGYNQTAHYCCHPRGRRLCV